jgi:hypothetical protein
MTLERSTKARLTTGIVLFLVLCAGVALGVALDRQLEARGVIGGEARSEGRKPGPDERRRGFDPRSRDSSRGPSEGRDSTRRRPSLIVEQVGLSEAQIDQADSVYWHYRSQMRALHEEFDEAYHSRYREIMAKSREEMLRILTAEQRVVYDSLLVEMRNRREQARQDTTGRSEGDRPDGRGGPRIP